MIVEGDNKGTYFVHLYHSDNPGVIFATWPCREQMNITLAQENVPVTLASEWGIRISFENNATS